MLMFNNIVYIYENSYYLEGLEFRYEILSVSFL